jgi:hypothetical protein
MRTFVRYPLLVKFGVAYSVDNYVCLYFNSVLSQKVIGFVYFRLWLLCNCFRTCLHRVNKLFNFFQFLFRVNLFSDTQAFERGGSARALLEALENLRKFYKIW